MFWFRLDWMLVQLVSVVMIGNNTLSDGSPAAMTKAHLHTSLPLLGEFQLLQQIGKGGFGAVYRATHARHPGEFAIKLILPHQQGKEELVQRFRREADTLAHLHHENIVRLVDFGQVKSMGFYIAMEYLRGRDMHQLIHEEYPLPCHRIFNIVRQLCAVLSYAHQSGVFHRDLKPSNIFITQKSSQKDDDIVKLIDFGIAIVEGDTQLTQTGAFLGSPAFISPEQMRGQSTTIDGRTDLYALGVILYLLLTKKFPFVALNLPGYVAQHLFTPPPLLSSLRPDVEWHPSLEACLIRCLAKEVEQRYQTADALWLDFSSALLAQGELPPISSVDTQILPVEVGISALEDTESPLRSLFTAEHLHVPIQSLSSLGFVPVSETPKLRRLTPPGEEATHLFSQGLVDDKQEPQGNGQQWVVLVGGLLVALLVLWIGVGWFAAAPSGAKALSPKPTHTRPPEVPLRRSAYQKSIVPPIPLLPAFQAPSPPSLPVPRQPEPLFLGLALSTKPKGASVWIDGKRYCTAPCTLQGKRGHSIHLELRASSHHPLSVVWLWEVDQPTTKQFVLQPKQTSTRRLGRSSRSRRRVRRRRRRQRRKRRRKRMRPTQRKDKAIKRNYRDTKSHNPRKKDRYKIGDPLYDLGKQ